MRIPLPLAGLWDDAASLRDLDRAQIPPRAYLAIEGYLAELAGDIEAAAENYRQIGAEAPVWVQDWTHVRKAALRSTANNDEQVLRLIEKRYRTAWPWLSIEAMWTLGRILKVMPSRLAEARNALNNSLIRALALLPPAMPGTLQLERELAGVLWIELVEILLRRGSIPQFQHELDRATRVFRMYRRSSDVRRVNGEDDGAAVPDLRVRVEFICVPGSRIFVIATTTHDAIRGFIPTYVDELSSATYRYQSLLYASDRQHPMKTLDWLIEVNRAVLGVRRKLESLLLHPEVEWSDGQKRSLARVFQDYPCVEIIAHGPTQIVPWALLRYPSGECAGETTAFVSSPTDLEVQTSERTGTGTVEEQLRVEETASDLLQRLRKGRIAWLRGHGRFTSSDPLATTLTPLAGGNGIMMNELLKCSAGRPLRNVFALFVSVCEAAETHRRSVAFDFLNVGYAMLASGARAVVVPTMTVTAASDMLVRSAIDALNAAPDARVPQVWRAVVAPYLAQWRSELGQDALQAQVTRAWQVGTPTLVDIAGFLVFQSAGEP